MQSNFNLTQADVFGNATQPSQIGSSSKGDMLGWVILFGGLAATASLVAIAQYRARKKLEAQLELAFNNVGNIQFVGMEG